MEKINVAELLKDCPKGMELDCTIWDNVTFECVDDREEFSIIIRLSDGCREAVTDYGCYSENDGAKCVIFPKGKTTWEGFKRPFKDGDIAVSNDGSFIGIVKYVDEDEGFIYTYCAINKVGNLTKNFPYYLHRFATEEEKQKLFQAIKANGYKWNAETKTLEKLVEPKFKVGDSIQSVRVNLGNIYNVIEVKESSYVVNKNNENSNFHIDFDIQDDWELVPNKFDINTLVPFESRVLVRGNDPLSEWKPAIFGIYRGDKHNNFYVVGGNCWKQCIPYEGNEHLIGTTKNCDAFYKTWK